MFDWLKKPSVAKRRLMAPVRRAFLAVAMLYVAVNSASACIPPQHQGPAEFVDGDLMTQISRHAAIIQVVQAAAPQEIPPNRRHSWAPRNAQSFELVVIRTLAAVPLNRSSRELRVTAAPAVATADRRSWMYGQIDRRENLRGGALLDPNWLPGPYGGFEAPEHMTNCQLPFIMAPGDMFIALRTRTGDLYVTGAPEERYLQLDIDRMGRRETVIAPGLIRISGQQDPLLIRLQQALLEEREGRNRLDQAVWWNALFWLVFA